jgi:hypothetical protein
MRKTFFLGSLISLGIAFLASTVHAQAPTVAFTTSGSCLNATSNFNSNLEPTKPNTAWTDTFAVVGTASPGTGNTSNVTEAGEYTISWPGNKATLSRQLSQLRTPTLSQVQTWTAVSPCKSAQSP